MNLKKMIGVLSMTVLAFGLAQAAPKKASKVQETTLKKVSGDVKWTGYGVGKSHVGTIAIKSGEVVMDKETLKQAQFTLDMKSLDTKDSDKLKGHLKSPDFFDVEKYPEAQFKSTDIKAVQNAQGRYVVKGDLTIKDKTQPIEFTTDVVKKDGKFTAIGNLEITDRTKYGINYHSKQFETASKLGDKLIEDNIKLEINVKAD